MTQLKHPRTNQWGFHDDGHWWDDWNSIRDDDPLQRQWQVDVAEAILFDGYCACGSPEKIVELMASFLTLARVSDSGMHHTQIVDNEPLDLMLAYWADRRRLTEHGGSVYGAWVTTAGFRWLELVES